ncbi:nucleoside 2-deoxyribosyltransferase [Leuconostoc mesenteroides]|uniref:nucleoside 2-deoxyribosyltransferase n=1 Tax=Leuconostoc mesenteroides TaxID=1245 RepID=UPI0009FD9335|nr:nucleoside 2-deoxyribosyltransferase [Leuconostoc mesenteroides]MCP9302237.1 nucleoside 2-deoxyribosyltransferase [Leuconostoc mesenteroides]MCP9326752.1 nucleoside 2-deoxyribosyltransferase [Leuconostoc mesenteroides]ORI80106.1 nucleoside 2-deoxyribosyltransferase [Leuconostoc mesenteroides subsp. mesenteroides]PAK81092.1 nucleoside 2-deoxyribosyltransferase [Leuconostoc mesenteroides]HBO55825.1 nucleoside 2-deoxyribosyltransferase [Leuconostoc mesenteroides]
MSKNVYLASPFFDKEQIERVERVEKALAANQTLSSVFSPREHQHEEFEMFGPEWRVATYNGDIEAINKADVMVAVIDYVGQEVDPGTAWEFGYAVAKNIPVIVVKEKAGAVNLMMGMPLTAYITDISDLETYDFDATPKIEFSGEIF